MCEREIKGDERENLSTSSSAASCPVKPKGFVGNQAELWPSQGVAPSRQRAVAMAMHSH